jgi:hypothetical protein
MRFVVMVVFTVSPLFALLLGFFLAWLTGNLNAGLGAQGMGGFVVFLALCGSLGWLVTVPIGIVWLIVLIVQEVRRPIAPTSTPSQDDSHL